MLVAQGNLPEALKSYRDSLAIADRLAKSDPGNAGWYQRARLQKIDPAKRRQCTRTPIAASLATVVATFGTSRAGAKRLAERV